MRDVSSVHEALGAHDALVAQPLSGARYLDWVLLVPVD